MSFSDEEVVQFAMEAFTEKYVNKQLNEEVEEWMKSLFS